jgi:protoporphyrin/coproporphyrin ferrochelatase
MNSTKAVLLMNLGSPDSTSVKDVRRYLNQFLMDKRVIDSPWIVRTIVVKGIIVPFRAKSSAEAYKSIWTKQGSPLIVISKNLQKDVQEKTELPVALSMRYGNPASEDVLSALHEQHPALEEILLVPLYPHYAMSSYETAVVQIRELHKEKEYKTKLTTIKPYYDNADYISALAETMRPYINKEYDKILFSYHGVPERHMKKSDCTGTHCLKVPDCCHVASPAHAHCYRHQTIRTTELITEYLSLPVQKIEQTFQSRLGRDPWLKPYTAIRLAELPAEGFKRIIVVCPAFVSDCLETLEEMAEEGKEIFLKAGGESFTLIPCMNTETIWVNTLVKWINEYGSGNKELLLNE